MAPSEIQAGLASRSLRDVAAELAAGGSTPATLEDYGISDADLFLPGVR